MKYWPSKTPAEVKDMGLDWGPTLSKLNDATIVQSTWTRLRGTVNVDAGAIEPGAKRTITRVYGGTAGDITVFRNTVTLSDNQILDEDVTIKVRA